MKTGTMARHASILVVLIGLCVFAQGRPQYCYQCRSRGSRGDCKDPFVYNSTTAEKVRGVKVIPCASQWCAKIIEGKDDDYDIATERMCLQRAPEDQIERCAETLFRRQKVFMCFCKGDLCNAATRGGRAIQSQTIILLVALCAFAVLWTTCDGPPGLQ